MKVILLVILAILQLNCGILAAEKSDFTEVERKKSNEAQPEDAKKRSRIAITATIRDVNGDGYLDEHELSDWIASVVNHTVTKIVDELFAKEDSDHDGVVTWIEHKRFYKNISSDRLHLHHQLFRLSNIVNKHEMNKKDYFLFAVPTENAVSMKQLLQHYFIAKDTNEDGAIDLAEFTAPRSNSTKQAYLESDKAVYNAIDRDHDGYLNINEVQRWILPLNKEIAAQEAKEILKRADDNGDKKLSYGEVTSNVQVFLDSKVQLW